MKLIQGDCIEEMRMMEDCSVDTVITDPPYGLEFMSKSWDSFRSKGIDLAFMNWFSGFVDGEGCFHVHKKPPSQACGGRIQT